MKTLTNKILLQSVQAIYLHFISSYFDFQHIICIQQNNINKREIFLCFSKINGL